MNDNRNEKWQLFLDGKIKFADFLGFDAPQLAALMITGHILYDQGKLEEARCFFEGLVILDGKNPYLHAALASTYQQEGNLDGAINHYGIALRLLPGEAYSLVNRGEIFLQLGKLREAAADFGQVMQLDVDGKHPAVNRARALVAITNEALKIVRLEGLSGLDAVRKQLA